MVAPILPCLTGWGYVGVVAIIEESFPTHPFDEMLCFIDKALEVGIVLGNWNILQGVLKVFHIHS